MLCFQVSDNNINKFYYLDKIFLLEYNIEINSKF